jgi:hypothetical protein
MVKANISEQGGISRTDDIKKKMRRKNKMGARLINLRILGDAVVRG